MHALGLAGFIPSIPLPLEMVSVLRLFDRLSREVDVFVRYHICCRDYHVKEYRKNFVQICGSKFLETLTLNSIPWGENDIGAVLYRASDAATIRGLHTRPSPRYINSAIKVVTFRFTVTINEINGG